VKLDSDYSLSAMCFMQIFGVFLRSPDVVYTAETFEFCDSFSLYTYKQDIQLSQGSNMTPQLTGSFIWQTDV